MTKKGTFWQIRVLFLIQIKRYAFDTNKRTDRREKIENEK